MLIVYRLRKSDSDASPRQRGRRGGGWGERYESREGEEGEGEGVENIKKMFLYYVYKIE